MKLLIDTHCWLWWLSSPERLNERSRSLLEDGRNIVLLSAASAWEIAIKVGLQKLALPMPPEQFVPFHLADQGMDSLPVVQAHSLRAGSLPAHHRDPFDRMLIAQAQVERVALMTADEQLKAYEVQLLWASQPGT